MTKHILNEHKLIQDISSQIRGVSYKKKDISEVPLDGYIPLLRANNISEGVINFNKLVFVKEDLVKKEQIIKKFDILVATSSGSKHLVGKSAQFSNEVLDKVTFGAFCKVIRPDTNFVNPRYLGNFFKSELYRRNIERLLIGSNINNLRNEHIDKQELVLPNKNTQKDVTKIIGQIESVIYKRQQQIKALSALKQSVFLDMFGDPTSNPKRYVKKQLKEIGEITTGNTPPRKDKDNYGDYVEWIKTNNINENSIYLSQAIEYLSEKGASIGRVVSENSILVTCIAGSRSSIGRAAIANRRVAFNQQINAISPSEIINTSFLYTQIKILKPYIQSFSTNSMKGMISKTNFEKIEVIVPTLEVQEEFHHKFKQINSIEKKMKNSLICLEEMYDSLLQKAFNGELLKEEIKA